MSTETIKSNNYKDFIICIKQEVIKSRNTALKIVNKELVSLYFKLGEIIGEKVEQSSWGKNIIETISEDLKKEFPGIQGFSKQNIWNMIKFYNFYSQNLKLQPLAGEISWSNNIIILEKCETNFQKEYYIKLSKKLHLSKRVLQNKIESHEFERILSKEKTNNFKFTVEEEHLELVQNSIKDSYIFDFLSLGDEYKERDLEVNLLKNLKKFILELGIGFAYVGNQYNLRLEEEDYFLDMLFYHTKLKCYIVIELKIGKFLPEYAGKLNFYLNLVDGEIKEKNDNPTIGILICKDKNKKTVDYSLKSVTNPLVVSEYHFKDLPEEFKNNLPDENKINTFLDNF